MQENITRDIDENESIQHGSTATNSNTKFCKHCGKLVDKEAYLCIHCGKMIEDINNNSATPQVIVNNTNTNNLRNAIIGPKPKNKWVSFFLCLCLGCFGAHKFYEGKIIFGIIYLLTFGLLFFGVIIDLVLILLKPNPYY